MFIQLTMLFASIGWLMLVVAMFRTTNYFNKFQEISLRNEREMTAVNNQLRKTNEYLGSLLLEISSVNRTVKGAVAEQTGKPEIEDVEFTADNGIFREIRREDELFAKSREEANIKERAKIKAKIETEAKPEAETKTKLISIGRLKAAIKTAKKPVSPTLRGPVVEIIPKMDES